MSKIIYHDLNRSYTGSKKRSGEKKRTEHYDIGFDEPPDDEMPCYLHEDSPIIGDEHRNDSELFVVALDASSVDAVKFDLAVKYERFKPEDRKNPLSRAAVITARTVQELIWTNEDADGKTPRNKAGDKFAARQVRESMVVISFRKNLPVDPWPAWLFELRDAINQSSMRIKGRRLKKRTLRLDNLVVPEEKKENDTLYLPVTYDLTHNRKTWLCPKLNEGLYEIKTVDIVTDADVDANPGSVAGEVIKTREKILNGTPREWVRERVFLDENGKAYHQNDDIDQPLRTDLKDEEIITIEVKDYRELNLNVLPMR